jgi:uncharacterized protein (DUF302 family)
MAYGMQLVVEQPYGVVVDRVRAALTSEGLVVLTAVDVAETLKHAFDLDLPPQVALGVCTELLAHATLRADSSVGLLVPCSVVVRATAAEATVVEAPKLTMIVAITGDRTLEPAVDDAINRLRAAFARLELPAATTPDIRSNGS